MYIEREERLIDFQQNDQLPILPQINTYSNRVDSKITETWKLNTKLRHFHAGYQREGGTRGQSVLGQMEQIKIQIKITLLLSPSLGVSHSYLFQVSPSMSPRFLMQVQDWEASKPSSLFSWCLFQIYSPNPFF